MDVSVDIEEMSGVSLWQNSRLLLGKRREATSWLNGESVASDLPSDFRFSVYGFDIRALGFRS